MTAPTPWLLQRDGTMLDRAAGHIVGWVYLVPGSGPNSGWTGESALGDRPASRGWRRRKDAAREAWQMYARATCKHTTIENGRCTRCGIPTQQIPTT